MQTAEAGTLLRYVKLRQGLPLRQTNGINHLQRRAHALHFIRLNHLRIRTHAARQALYNLCLAIANRFAFRS